MVHDDESGLYYMYYWYGWSEPEGLFLVTSPNETGFDFNEAVNISIEGDDSFMKKFGHVVKDNDGWHMFYSNFVQPHCPNSITRYAYSTDGIHWEAKNTRLLKGHDSEVLPVTEDLHLMFYSPQNHFDKKDCDIRLAIYNDRLAALAQKPSFVDEIKQTSIVGKSFVVMDVDISVTYTFKIDGEVVISEEANQEEEGYAFSAYFIQDGDQIQIMGENLNLKGSYDGNDLEMTHEEEN